jgi:hypothetical protein
MQSLHHQQPHHYQGSIDAIVVADAGLLERLLDERNGQQLLEEGQNSRNGRCREVRRERES